MENKKIVLFLTLAMTVITFLFLVAQFIPHYVFVQDLTYENEAGEWVHGDVPVKYSVAGFTWMNSYQMRDWASSSQGMWIRDFDFNKNVNAIVFAFLAAAVSIVLNFSLPNSIFTVIVSAVFGGFGSIGYLFTSLYIFTDQTLVTETAYTINGWIDIISVICAAVVLVLTVVKFILLIPYYKDKIAKMNKKYR